MNTNTSRGGGDPYTHGATNQQVPVGQVKVLGWEWQMLQAAKTDSWKLSQ